MTDAIEHPVPIQRLKDIEDASVRDHAVLGVQATLDANLSHLRSIKDTELNWLQLFAIVTLPAIGYLMGVGDENPVFGWPILLVMLFYLAFTGWVQHTFLRERISYYSVLRSVVRAQNLLGLFDFNYLSPHFAGSAFPKGFGPNPERNGTQPLSSFLRRQVYTLILYTGMPGVVAFRTFSATLWFAAVATTCIVCLLLDVVWLRYLFSLDETILKAETAGERDLAGYDPAWSPSPQKTD